jgi:hypothetical protein
MLIPISDYFKNLAIPLAMSPSTSASRSFLKGLGMSNNSMILDDFDPLDKVTTNAPLRGLSSLIAVLNPASFRRPSTMALFFLNTCQLLQCSILAPLSHASMVPLVGLDEAAFFAGDGLAAFAVPLAFLTWPAFVVVFATIFKLNFTERRILLYTLNARLLLL